MRFFASEILERMKIVLCSLLVFPPFILFSQQPKLVLPIGHTSLVVSAVYSPDDKYIVTASWDNTAKVWLANEGRLLFELKGHTATVNTALFSPDGKHIVTASKDNTAKIWDASTGDFLFELKGHHDCVNTAVYSVDGKYIVTSSWDSTAKVWDALNGKLIFDLKGHQDLLSVAVFSGDAKKILTASWDGTARIWDAQDGKLLHELKTNANAIDAAGFSPDGTIAVTASRNGIVKLWDVSSGEWLHDLETQKESVSDISFNADGKNMAVCTAAGIAKIFETSGGNFLFELKGHQGYIKSVRYDREGKFILTASSDSTAGIWDASNGKLLHSLKGHLSWVNSAVFSNDGKYIVTGSSDRTAKIWEASSGKILYDLNGSVVMPANAAFSMDNKYVISISTDSIARIWDNENGKLLYPIIRNISWMCPVAFSPDGKNFAVASLDNNTEIYELSDLKLIHKLKGHYDWIISILFSSDGKKIITTSWDSTAKIWNASDGRLLHDLRLHKDVVNSAAFSQNGKLAATTSWDATAKVWNVSDGKLLCNLKGHKNKVRSAVFSSDGKYILTASWDSTAKIWKVADGKLVRTFKGHKGFVNSAWFNNDEKKILTSSMDSTARIWDVVSGKILFTLQGHKAAVISAFFSKDGKSMYTSSWDNTAKAWNVADGHILYTMEGHSAPLNSISLSADQKNMLTTSEDNTIKKWDAKSGELLYSFFGVGRTDYLLVDKEGRFEGTEWARQKLYYSCGNEIVDLEQFKNLAWEPGLAGKTNGIYKEIISAKRLSEIDICNYTAIVAEKGANSNAYLFQVTPRNGGIGMVQLFVNNKLIKEYSPLSLQKKDNSYFLSVNKKEVEEYFVSDADNHVSVKATTLNGAMQSRGRGYTSSSFETRIHTTPNMYIISVGISDYKGIPLKLDYASKDAADFSSAIKTAAQKLLNTDSREHVFVYTFNTDPNNKLRPFKKEIQAAIDSIAQRAKPDDIMIAFFGGHGVIPAGQKKFYMLTAEAVDANIAGVEKDVAISTDELNEWSRKIKANKQLLILDACSSGQVINNLEQLIRGDVPADQQRALENLKDRTGIYILSASESGQEARESGVYNQGLLTYSLLTGIKFGDGLRDNKFIDVSKWFNFASHDVKRLAMENGHAQNPQILGSASFDVGIVDKEVADGIRLFLNKKIFRRSRFIEDEELLTDDIDLSIAVDKELNNVSEKGVKNSWAFVADNIFDSAYSVHGKYAVNGNIITAKVILIKGLREKACQFEVKGLLDKKEELARKIIEKIINYFNFGFLPN